MSGGDRQARPAKVSQYVGSYRIVTKEGRTNNRLYSLTTSINQIVYSLASGIAQGYESLVSTLSSNKLALKPQRNQGE